ncbi:unnamed protein product [Arabidopsis halleri]
MKNICPGSSIIQFGCVTNFMFRFKIPDLQSSVHSSPPVIVLEIPHLTPLPSLVVVLALESPYHYCCHAL